MTRTAPLSSLWLSTQTAKSYILAPDGLKVGDTVMAGPTADIKPGNALPLRTSPSVP